MGVQLYSIWISAASQTLFSTSNTVSPSAKLTFVLGRIVPFMGTKGAFSSFRLLVLSRMVSQTMVIVQT